MSISRYVCEATTFIREGDEIVTSYHHYHYQVRAQKQQ